MIAKADSDRRVRNRSAIATRALARVLGLSLALTVALTVVELALRVPLIRVPNQLATYLYSCYEPVNPRRYLFVALPQLGLGAHRPNANLRCYFNSYHWHHHSDKFGWRNPETWDRVDVALLGDSMIYGHGVEETDTVANQVRIKSGLKVANLGITGACPATYLGILRNFAIPLSPKLIVVYFYTNDLDDLRSLRSRDQIQRFLESGEAPEMRIEARDDLLREVPRLPKAPPLDGLYLARTVRFLSLDRKAKTGSLAQGFPPSLDFSRTGAPLNSDCTAYYAKYELELRYVNRAVAEMSDSAASAQSRLLVGFLPYPTRTVDDICFKLALKEIARQSDVPLLTPRLHDNAGRALPGARLPLDGHLTQEGAVIVAEDLLEHSRQFHLTDPSHADTTPRSSPLLGSSPLDAPTAGRADATEAN